MQFYIIGSLVLTLFLGCNPWGKNDVYNIIRPNSELSKEILIKSEQIIPLKSGLITVYNISDDWKRYDPHLLFYDAKLVFYTSCYFPSERVDSIKNNVIYCVLNESRDVRKNEYRNDLPQSYSFNFIKDKCGGKGIRSNKLVDKIQIDPNLNSLILFIRCSVNNYEGTEWTLNKKNSVDLNAYNISDTIYCRISNIIFFSKESKISVISKDSDGCSFWDEMIIVDKSVFNKFYDELWVLIKKNKIPRSQ